MVIDPGRRSTFAPSLQASHCFSRGRTVLLVGGKFHWSIVRQVECSARTPFGQARGRPPPPALRSGPKAFGPANQIPPSSRIRPPPRLHSLNLDPSDGTAARPGPERHCRESESLRTDQGRREPEWFRAFAERPGARGVRVLLEGPQTGFHLPSRSTLPSPP